MREWRRRLRRLLIAVVALGVALALWAGLDFAYVATGNEVRRFEAEHGRAGRAFFSRVVR